MDTSYEKGKPEDVKCAIGAGPNQNQHLCPNRGWLGWLVLGVAAVTGQVCAGRPAQTKQANWLLHCEVLHLVEVPSQLAWRHGSMFFKTPTGAQDFRMICISLYLWKL